MLKRAKYVHLKLNGDINPAYMAAWLPDVRRWPSDHLSEVVKLKVLFLNECPGKWQCKGTEEIMMFLDESWADCFELGGEDSPIRVKFEGMKTTHVILLWLQCFSLQYMLVLIIKCVK